MKQIDYILTVREIGTTNSWNEPISEIVEDDITIDNHAKELVRTFNKYKAPNITEREFISAVEKERTEELEYIRPHKWHKTNLITTKGGYDKMECTVCGATGKRYGFVNIGIDHKFRKYEHGCPGELIIPKIKKR